METYSYIGGIRSSLPENMVRILLFHIFQNTPGKLNTYPTRLFVCTT